MKNNILYLEVPGEVFGGARRYLLDLIYLFKGDSEQHCIIGKNKVNASVISILENANVTCYDINLTSKDQATIVNLYNVISKIEPNIIYVNNSNSNVLDNVINYIKQYGKGNAKWVYTMHLPPKGLSQYIESHSIKKHIPFTFLYKYRKRNEIFFKSFDKIISVSNKYLQMATSIAPTIEENIIYIPNGVNTKEFSPPTTRSSDKLIIGGCGRLSEMKNFPLLIKAFSQVQSANKNIELRIAGEGNTLEELKRLRTELGLEKSIHFLGHQENPQEFYKELDVFILSSNREAFPFVILEAMATGLPIIATNVGDVPLMLQHDVNGYICPSDDVSALSRRLNQLISNEEKRNDMGKINRELAQSKYSREQYLLKTKSEILPLLEK